MWDVFNLFLALRWPLNRGPEEFLDLPVRISSLISLVVVKTMNTKPKTSQTGKNSPAIVCKNAGGVLVDDGVKQNQTTIQTRGQKQTQPASQFHQGLHSDMQSLVVGLCKSARRVVIPCCDKSVRVTLKVMKLKLKVPTTELAPEGVHAGTVKNINSKGESKCTIEFGLVVDGTNFTNHPGITGLNTVINASNYGLPIAAQGMRSVSATVRLRF